MRRLQKPQKRAVFLTRLVFRAAAYSDDLPRNMLLDNKIGAKRALSEPRQNRVTYNKVVDIVPRNVVVLHSMKRVRASSLKVCGGKRPEWPSVSVALPPSFSTTARQADANVWERDRPGRRVRRPDEHLSRCFCRASRETRSAATGRSEQHKSGPLRGLVARPTHRIAEHSRLLAYVRGFVRNSLISRIGLVQVVDFHDISGYFSWCLRCPLAIPLQFLNVQDRLTQLVDFHDSFR